ncbi:MAG: hypothetical protein R3C53_22665 [Pirellulaceae bacterium]
MTGFSYPSEDVLVVSRGRVPLFVIGCVLLSFGLLMLYGAYVLAMSDGQLAGKVVGGIAAVLFGSLFVCGGILLLNGPDQTTIDRRQQIVMQQYGSMVALRRREFPLGDFHSVRVERAKLKGDTSSVPSYRITLVAPEAANIIVLSVREPQEAEKMAEQLRRFLNLPLETERSVE